MIWEKSADLQNLVQQSLQKVTEVFGELSMRKLASLLVLTLPLFPLWNVNMARCGELGIF